MRVLIGPMARQAGRQGIQRLLEWAPEGMINFNIVHCVGNWPALLEAVRIGAEDATRKYDVLVAEFRLSGNPEFAAINTLDPTISVIDIDLDRGTSNTPMFDVSSAKLRRLAEWLTKEAGLTSTPAAMAALVGNADEHAPETPAEGGRVPEPGTPRETREREGPSAAPEPEASEERPMPEAPFRPRLVATGTHAPPDPEAQLEDLVLWLELRLASMLSPSSAEILSLDLPGWGINANRARLLLGDDLAELPQPELLRRWEEVDARLHGYVEAARHHSGGSALGSICHAFGLDEIERQMLWIAAAPDIAGNLAQAIGFLNDDLSVRRPTFSLLAQMIEGAGRPWKLQRRLAGSHPFGRFRLLNTVRTEVLTPDSLCPLRVPEDIVALLRGCPPDAIEGATLYDPADFAEAFDPQLALVQWAAGRGAGERPIMHFHAPPSEAAWLARQLASAGNRVLVGNLAPVAGQEPQTALDRLLSFGHPLHQEAPIASAISVPHATTRHAQAGHINLS